MNTSTTSAAATDRKSLASIVTANLSDSSHQQYLLELLSDYYASPMGNGCPIPESVRDRVVSGLNGCQNCRVFLALSEDDKHSDETVSIKPTGLAVCFVNYSTFKAMPLINIHDLAVHSRHQGQGIGKMLIQRVIEYARSIACCAVTLEVRRDNTVARSLYSKLGFNDVAEPMTDSSMLFGKLYL
jgi:GNAT superfamily N-acetyltransferase